MEYNNDKGGGLTEPDGDAVRRFKIANFFYVVVFVLIGIVGFILYNTGDKWLGKIIKTFYDTKSEIGIACVARTTCPLAIWFAIHSLICVCNKDLESSWQFLFHTTWLWLHFLIFIGIWIGFWFIPDPFFDFYMQFSIYASGVYLIIQAFFLTEFLHKLNDHFVNMDKMIWVVLLTILFGVGSLVAYGVSYYLFTVNGCSQNNIFISVNLVISIILFVASAFLERGSIFTASLISAYTAYLTIAAMMCQTECNRISTGNQGIGFSLTAALFTLVWAGYSAYSSTNQFDACTCSEEEKPFSLSFFHFVFAMASIYITMIVTHWGKVGVNNSSWAVDRGMIARWVNFAASWLVFVLYAWSLIAPLVCKDRNFD
ncbi:hypothetical protein TRFO_25605 [Tritrichomonas foetus]|uniref:Serine incorporator n=1 Tax=Tritrichomonas foetus TaxID=1144522 RepID=A0A1J4K9M6_9EUKA|nr:hypothetical protein TRFO_25605 [Tritrichomonas foetus]|eukprot:OHT06334.1 hypothetical protein TRFO_25605 [Tritrichomonas foetus]